MRFSVPADEFFGRSIGRCLPSESQEKVVDVRRPSRTVRVWSGHLVAASIRSPTVRPLDAATSDGRNPRISLSSTIIRGRECRVWLRQRLPGRLEGYLDGRGCGSYYQGDYAAPREKGQIVGETAEASQQLYERWEFWRL
jgi:hypothetical protein